MAALICDSVGKLCGTVCTAPCKLCGDSCGDCCRSIGSCCSSVCRVLSTVVCSAFFPFLAVTTIFNIPPLIWGFKSIPSSLSNKDDCGKAHRWLWANGIFCVAHLLAALYIVYKVRKSDYVNTNNSGGAFYTSSGPSTTATPATTSTSNLPMAQAVVGDEETGDNKKRSAATSSSSSNNNTADESTSKGGGLLHAVAKAVPAIRDAFQKDDSGENTRSRSYANRQAAANTPNDTTPAANQQDMRAVESTTTLSEVLCYDPGVAIYMMICLGWLVWIGYGFYYATEASLSDNEACDDATNLILSSVSMGVVFVVLSCCTLACSMVCCG